MLHYPVDDLLLFGLRHVIDRSSTMQLGLTAVFAFLAIKHLINVDCLSAAAVFIGALEGSVQIHLDLGRDFVVSAVAHFGYGIVLLAPVALQQVQVRPDLPVDLFP